MKKQLIRDTHNALIGGVVAGLANYFGHDITLWRLGVILVFVFTGFFPIGVAYLVMWVIMPTVPREPEVTYVVNE